MDPRKSLLDQLKNAFTIEESPVWMDSSTTSECRKIEEACGGAMELAQVTGSRAYERFTGPQIKKISSTQPDVYKNTERISVVSSFMASLLVGGYAPIDHSDGAGMNLMDIKKKEWSKVALEVCNDSNFYMVHVKFVFTVHGGFSDAKFRLLYLTNIV